MSQSTVGVNILSNTVSIGGSNVSGFNDLIVAELTPLVQADFVYGLNTYIGTETETNSATVDTNNSRLRLQCGTNAAGDGQYRSVATSRYKPGQGQIARFTCAWSGSAANNTQIVGVGTAENGFFFGYNGTSFGILRRSNSVDNWVAQSSWSGDTCDGTGASAFNWDTTKGNVMMISYPYLGYGSIKFYVMNPVDGSWILCHTIEYPNSSQDTSVLNPSFPFFAQTLNTGNTTNLIMYIGSFACFISGLQTDAGVNWALDNLKTAVSTETNIISLRNATTYNIVTNYSTIRLKGISCASDGGNGNAILRLKVGATLGGSPSYAAVSGSTADSGVTITSGLSVASYDTAGTTVTGGQHILNVAFARNNSTYVDLIAHDISLHAGETMTFSVESQVNSDVRIGINWQEEV